MRQITCRQAITEGLAAAMRRDPTTFLVGEGIAKRGGCFAHTKGLYEEFGPERVVDLPISEAGFVGMCAGAAMCGSRAVVDLMFLDFASLVMDQLVNQAAKIRYLSAGQFRMPLTILAMYGMSGSGGAHHSQSFYSWFVQAPGIKVVLPATPHDLKGLLASAILDDNVVVVLVHKMLINMKGPVPAEDYTLQLGQAKVVREGRKLTIVATAMTLHEALKAANQLSAEGIDAEVIDLCTLMPLDVKTVAESVKKTGRLLVVDEGCGPCGMASEVAAWIQRSAFDYLDAPIECLHAPHVSIPYSPPLEQSIRPDANKIVRRAKEMVP